MLVALGSTSAHAQDVTDDGRVAATFAHPTLLDRVSGAPYVWVDDQTGSVTSYRVAFPNLIYHATPWLQGWGGLIVNWKNDSTSDDTRELRPYIGVKVFVPNSAHIHVFDWTRYEFRRTTNTEKETVARVWRFRTRLQRQQLSSRLQVQFEGRTTSHTGWTAITSRTLRDTDRVRGRFFRSS